MKFKIEQLAIMPKSINAAMELLTAMGCTEWSHDTVVAEGAVFGGHAQNTAELYFNYQLDRNTGHGDNFKPLEFEVLDYTDGQNWIEQADRDLPGNGPLPCVSHVGMHCSDAMLAEWKAFFEARNIPIAQEVNTTSHTNPVIAGMREYTYCIFDTRHILGFDVKLIVRRELGRSSEGMANAMADSSSQTYG